MVREVLAEEAGFELSLREAGGRVEQVAGTAGATALRQESMPGASQGH